MNNNQFVISIGDHKKVIFAKILSETNSMTCVISMANTHTNRQLVTEREVSELKTNRNCTTHTYKVKNHKYKTIHKCLVYNFMNTQDRLKFMDNLVNFLMRRRFPNTKKPFQIFELMRAKGKDTWMVSMRKLKENSQTTVSPRPKVYHRPKRKHNLLQENDQSPSCNTVQRSVKQRTILQIPVPRTCASVMNIRKKRIMLETKQMEKLTYMQKRVPTAKSRPITRSITRKNMQSVSSKSNTA